MSEPNPVELVVAAFHDERGADDAMDSLVQAKKEHTVKIKEAAIVRRSADNKLHIKERGDISAGRGAAGGATVGAIVGLFGGPIGAVVGGAVGAAIGGLAAKILDTGIPDDQLRQIGESLTPGTSAIVALIGQTWVGDLKDDLARAGADLLTTPISEDIATQLAEGRDVAYGAMAAGGSVVAEGQQDVQSAAGSAAGAVATTTDAIQDTAADAGAAAREVAGDTVQQAQRVAGDVADTAGDAAADAAAATKKAADDVTGGSS